MRKQSAEIVPLLSVLATVMFGSFCLLLETPLWILVLVSIALLTPAFLSRWESWRNEGSRWAGVFIVFPVAYVIAYSLGSVPIGTQGPSGVRPDQTQWILYVVGLLAYLIGAAFWANRGPLRPEGLAPRRTSTTLGVFAALTGLSGAAVNYATGGIPVLAENINAARFGENQSLLGPLTGFIVGAEQAGLVVLTLAWYTARKRGLREPLSTKVLVITLIGSLALSGSRSFIILPIIAILLAIAEFNLVKSITFVLIVIVGFSGVTAYNLIRQQQSGTLEKLNAALERNGVGEVPLASGLLGLQIGPSVMQMSRDKIPSNIDFQNGQFFLADGSILLRTHQPPSDYFTTVYVAGRSYTAAGGSPPTVLGGFYIDGGVPLIVIGMALLGLISRLLRNTYLQNPTIYSGATYGYWAAWMVLSIYGYISLKPMVLTFFVVTTIGALTSRGTESKVLLEDAITTRVTV